MPQLADVLKKREKKKFVKKDYRATDVDLPFKKSDDASKKEAPAQEEALIENSDNKTENETVTARQQPDNSQVTAREHVDNTEVTLRKHADNTKTTTREQTDNEEVTTRQHSDNKLWQQTEKPKTIDANTFNPEEIIAPKKKITLASLMISGEEEKYQRLSGIQKKILLTVVAICNEKNSLCTGNIESNKLAQYLNISYGTLKTSLSRLIKKGFIQRGKGKPSQGGFIILNITQALKDMASSDLALDQDFLREPSSNSSNNINTTTSNDNANDEWSSINFDSLRHIGFSQTQILQLKNKQLSTPEMVQHSINHFAYGLEFNPKIKKYDDPLNVLMGVLIKGGQWSEKDYRSPAELAKEARLKQLQVQLQREKELDQSLFDAEYTLWLSQLDNDSRTTILKETNLPPTLREEKADHFLRIHFKNRIYKK